MLTSPLWGDVLGGVAREVLLGKGLVSEGPLPPEVESFYRVNAVRGIELVTSLDGRALRWEPEMENLFWGAL